MFRIAASVAAAGEKVTRLIAFATFPATDVFLIYLHFPLLLFFGIRLLSCFFISSRINLTACSQGGDILSRVAAVNDALVGSGRVEPSRMNVRFSIRPMRSFDSIFVPVTCDIVTCIPSLQSMMQLPSVLQFTRVQVGFVGEGSAASNVTFAKGW